MYTDFMAAVWELVCSDDEAAMQLLRPLGSASAMVELVEGSVTVEDAVAYAHGLAELGLDAQAQEIFDAVVESLLGAGPQGSQQVALPATPQGAQGGYWS